MIKHNVTATNMELTEAISDYLTKRLTQLEKFVDKDSEAIARVEVGKISNHHHKGEIFRAGITIDIEREQFRAEAETTDLYTAIDTMKEEVIHEITRASKKRKHLLKRGHQKIKDMMRRWTGR